NENNNLINKENSVNTWHHIRDSFLRFIVGIAIIAMMIWANIQVGDGAISATIIAAFVLMMFSITDALLPMSDAVEEIPTYLDSLRRMIKLQEQENNTLVPTMVEEITCKEPTIHIKNIRYQYEENSRNVIDNLSLTI